MNNSILKSAEDKIEYTSADKLSYMRHEDEYIISLFNHETDKVLGCFRVWDDVETEDGEYIDINNSRVYLDTLNEIY